MQFFPLQKCGQKSPQKWSQNDPKNDVKNEQKWRQKRRQSNHLKHQFFEVVCRDSKHPIIHLKSLTKRVYGSPGSEYWRISALPHGESTSCESYLELASLLISTLERFIVPKCMTNGARRIYSWFVGAFGSKKDCQNDTQKHWYATKK